MREIKFRGFDGADWIYSMTIDYEQDSDTCWMLAGSDLIDDWKKVNRVGQYTGLKDKNGFEIYEGDIVSGINRGNDGWEFKQLVTYLKGCFMFGNWNSHEYFNQHQEITVIGNIYEHPHLLEMQND